MIEEVVYKPHMYNPSQKYPILLVPDADPMLGIIKTMNFLWTEEQYTIPIILVGIPFGKTPGSIWVNRSYYFLPDSVGTINYYGNSVPLNNGGGAQEFVQFLNKQVLPTIDREYNVDQERIGLIGFSMGGLFAAWHLVNYPGYFSDYIIIAPPLDKHFIGNEFNLAFIKLKSHGFTRFTNVYVAYAEHDLDSVRKGAGQWIEDWKDIDDENLNFLGEEIKGLRHDSGAIPATINGYRFLYGKKK